MMENLRKITKHILFKIFIIITIFSLLLTGISNFFYKKDSFVIKVNSKKITLNQLNQALEYTINLKKESMEKDKFLDFLNSETNWIKKTRLKVLYQLIDEILIEEYAKKIGLIINQNQIKEFIFSSPYFMTDQKFDEVKFFSFITKIGLTTKQYIQLIEKQLLIKQLIEGIEDNNFLFPSEIKKLLELSVHKRFVRLAKFNIQSVLKGEKVQEYEIKDFYNQNKDKYFFPETFKIKYILLDFKKIKQKIDIKDQNIKDWYNDNIYNFTNSKKKKFFLFYVKNEKDANIILNNPKFDLNLFKIEKDKYIDFFLIKEGEKEIWINDTNKINELNKINSEETGKIFKIKKSSKGFLIARLENIKPINIVPLYAVQNFIKEKLKKEKFNYFLEKIERNIIKNNNFNNFEKLDLVEKETNVKIQRTNFFNYKNIPKEIDFQTVKEILFLNPILKNENISEKINLVNINSNKILYFYIFKHFDKKIKPLRMVKNDIKEKIKYKKAVEEIVLNKNKIINEIKKNENNFLFKKYNLLFGNLIQFDSLYQNSPLIKTIFSLPKPKNGTSSYGIEKNKKGELILIKLENVKPYSLNYQQKTFFTNKINREITYITFESLLDNLRKKANIEIREDFFIE